MNTKDQAEEIRRKTAESVHANALAAATRLLGPRRPHDARAFADLVLVRYNAVDDAFRELMKFDPSEMGRPEYYAAFNKLMETAQSNIATIAVEALRIAQYGPERSRTQ